MTITEELIDYTFLTAHLYVLIRLRFSSHDGFRTPFFRWFQATGFFSGLSVIGYIIASRISWPTEYSWAFKVGYLLNSFTVTAATIGKVYMSMHRLAVLRSASLIENIWTWGFTSKLVAAQLSLSAVQCGHIFFCDYSYVLKNEVRYVTYFDDRCTVFEKSKSSVIYLIFVLFSTILIVLTSREMLRLSRFAQDQTKKLLIASQRQMFIVVSVCSITHLIKAIHQMCWVLVAGFGLPNFGSWLLATYPYTHYLSTYSSTFTLILFNSRVRWLLISIHFTEREIGTTRGTSMSRF